MNSIPLIALASVLVTSMRSGCDGPEPQKTLDTTTDPVVYAQGLTAVCKVGERGGDGTLIAPEWVLTAGHVAEGMYQRTNGQLKVYFDNGSTYEVRNVFLDPRFEPMGEYDIALLQLERVVEGVKPIGLYSTGDETGQPIIIAGHGDRRNADGSWLRDGKLRAYTNRIDAVNDTHILFDYDAPGKDATVQEGTSGPGDSGGPAFIETPHGLAVAGISSMGEPGAEGPCTYGAVEHFVRVSSFQKWIVDVMNEPDAQMAPSIDKVPAPKLTAAHIGGSKKDLGDSLGERAAQEIVDALGSGDRARLREAINSAYDPEILARRDAAMIMSNMPALVERLSGARLVKVNEVSDDRISLAMEEQGAHYVLDIFITPAGKVEQMAFGRTD